MGNRIVHRFVGRSEGDTPPLGPVSVRHVSHADGVFPPEDGPRGGGGIPRNRHVAGDGRGWGQHAPCRPRGRPYVGHNRTPGEKTMVRAGPRKGSGEWWTSTTSPGSCERHVDETMPARAQEGGDEGWQTTNLVVNGGEGATRGRNGSLRGRMGRTGIANSNAQHRPNHARRPGPTTMRGNGSRSVHPPPSLREDPVGTGPDESSCKLVIRACYQR